MIQIQHINLNYYPSLIRLCVCIYSIQLLLILAFAQSKSNSETQKKKKKEIEKRGKRKKMRLGVRAETNFRKLKVDYYTHMCYNILSFDKIYSILPA